MTKSKVPSARDVARWISETGCADQFVLTDKEPESELDERARLITEDRQRIVEEAKRVVLSGIATEPIPHDPKLTRSGAFIEWAQSLEPKLLAALSAILPEEDRATEASDE